MRLIRPTGDMSPVVIEGRSFLFMLMNDDNSSYVAYIIPDNTSSLTSSSSAPHRDYDDTGALYYVLAVIFMYGCSIIMMFASFVNKSDQDNTIVTYMKDMERLGKLQMQQEKLRTTLHMHQQKVHRMSQESQGPITPPSPSMELFVWDVGRRQSSVSLCTTIVPASDLLDGGKGAEVVEQRRLSAPDATHGFRTSSSLLELPVRSGGGRHFGNIPRVTVQTCQ